MQNEIPRTKEWSYSGRMITGKGKCLIRIKSLPPRSRKDLAEMLYQKTRNDCRTNSARNKGYQSQQDNVFWCILINNNTVRTRYNVMCGSVSVINTNYLYLNFIIHLDSASILAYIFFHQLMQLAHVSIIDNQKMASLTMINMKDLVYLALGSTDADKRLQDKASAS